MTIEVEIRHKLGNFDLDVNFIAAGRLTALFGASGSGKTSVINTIAGMIKPTSARIVIDGRVLVDSAKGIFVPRHRRRIGYVFQEPRLFPHLSVRQNLKYGLWFTPTSERKADFSRIVELLGIASLLDRRPNHLSGGEKQRVAIGRALLTSPQLLLMDEPLASLDQARKLEILPYIERLRDESRVPIIYVSHAIGEVTRLATDIVVMSHGRSVEWGPTELVMQRLDVFPEEDKDEAGAIVDTVLEAYDPAYDMSHLRGPAGEFRIPGSLGELGSPIRLRLKARDVMLATERPRGLSALNVLEGVVSGIGERTGPQVEVRIDCHGTPVIARITRQSLDTLALRPGVACFAVVKSVLLEGAGRVPPQRLTGSKAAHHVVETS
ncbi:MAG: molybdenum ABC transporter ATP-binding protein [Hyphomicrobiales bacterium]